MGHLRGRIRSDTELLLWDFSLNHRCQDCVYPHWPTKVKNNVKGRFTRQLCEVQLFGFLQAKKLQLTIKFAVSSADTKRAWGVVLRDTFQAPGIH